MATFNGELFLREQLDSIYAQTLQPFEVVVSDDCSTDGTIDILKVYQNKYGLRYSVNKRNIGVNKNFEKAIRACQGNYIAVCDQDDIWFPEKLEISYQKLKEIEDEHPALVSSQSYHIDGEGNVISLQTNIKYDTSACVDTILQPSGVTQGCSLMFNKRLLFLLRPFPPTEVCMYDVYIGFVSACVGKKYNLAKPLMYHRHHNKNVTAPLHSKNKFYNILIFPHRLFNPKILPPQRDKSLLLINEEYGSLFRQEAKEVYKDAMMYYSANSFVNRIFAIIKMKSLNRRNKCELISGLILSILYK